ncbi:uncharacterized protein MONBRDRAFT_26454 [Monosiga brevicollis MX1]|uniref:Uncharacterized protein n=1 Tax=Monosiga brevicollis TaxID=81824 RepID=A9V2E8_MONBE|nr:uncharacterized protein MONBRDRAFT_26454 [Monosiga brevicollis MX1]EDQ88364.1 predicted protein [Monosiga brevicollis MX1]|eukprot:XP_001746957.1 hypothetical protein [Monosiga brevicollis MX1]
MSGDEDPSPVPSPKQPPKVRHAGRVRSPVARSTHLASSTTQVVKAFAANEPTGANAGIESDWDSPDEGAETKSVPKTAPPASSPLAQRKTTVGAPSGSQTPPKTAPSEHTIPSNASKPTAKPMHQPDLEANVSARATAFASPVPMAPPTTQGLAKVDRDHAINDDEDEDEDEDEDDQDEHLANPNQQPPVQPTKSRVAKRSSRSRRDKEKTSKKDRSKPKKRDQAADIATTTERSASSRLFGRRQPASTTPLSMETQHTVTSEVGHTPSSTPTFEPTEKLVPVTAAGTPPVASGPGGAPAPITAAESLGSRNATSSWHAPGLPSAHSWTSGRPADQASTHHFDYAGGDLPWSAEESACGGNVAKMPKETFVFNYDRDGYHARGYNGSHGIDHCAITVEKESRQVFAAVFAVLKAGINIFLALLFELVGLLLHIVRKVIIELLALVGDIIFKPLLHALFHGFIHPALVLVCARTLVSLSRRRAPHHLPTVRRAFRLVEWKTELTPHREAMEA